MQYNLDTPIRDLLRNSLISASTYYALYKARLTSLRVLLDSIKSSMDLVKFFGGGQKESVKELVKIIEPMQLSPKQSFGRDLMTLFMIPSIIREALYSSFKTVIENDRSKCFSLEYPSVALLHSTLMMHEELPLSLPENIEIQEMIQQFVKLVLDKLNRTRYSKYPIYTRYNQVYSEISKSIEDHKPAVSQELLVFIVNQYNKERYERLSVRTNNFLNKLVPDCQCLFSLINKPLEKYYVLCQGKYPLKAMTELYEFNQWFKTEYDRYINMSVDEMKDFLIKENYPYLTSMQRGFVRGFLKQYNHLPLFYLLYNYMRLSEAKNDKMFSMHYGLFDGKELDLQSISIATNMSRERCRQIAYSKLEVHDTHLMKEKGWDCYKDCLSLPIVTEMTKAYTQIKEQEHLNIDFNIFTRLLQIAGNFKVELMDNIVIAFNKQIIPDLELSKGLKTLKTKVSSLYSKDTYISVSSCFPSIPKQWESIVMESLHEIIRKKMGLHINNNGDILVKKNYVDVAQDIYEILDKKGKPMSIKELLDAFLKINPHSSLNCVYKLKPYLFKHPQICAIGHTSKYGLKHWKQVYYGNIRDLMIEVLNRSEVPLKADDIFANIVSIFPNTNIRSITASMQNDSQNRFVHYKNGFFGLKSKQYPSSYTVAINNQHLSFEDRLTLFCEFVDTYNRFPVNSNGDQEASLCRWLNRIRNNHVELSVEQRNKFEEKIAQYEMRFIPRNATESEFRNMCKAYKEYIASYHTLPTLSTESSLYSWYRRAKDNYNSYTDFRREYLSDLFTYLSSFGFKL